MPLKIIHHKEEETTKKRETLSIDDIEEIRPVPVEKTKEIVKKSRTRKKKEE